MAIDRAEVQEFAQESLLYLQEIERALDIRIVRVAVDAPSACKREGRHRRAAEQAMDAKKIRCFATPSQSEFRLIINKVNAHLDRGGSESTIPHANQLWMLAGFALFDELAKAYECIEVFPQATAVALKCAGIHKTKADGLQAQFRAASEATGWLRIADGLDLKNAAFGSAHDKLDAYLCAWIASLSTDERIACGELPGDVIWVPLPRRI